MFRENYSPRSEQSSLEPLLLLIGALLALGLALPALIIGMVLAQGSRPYRWSLTLWLLLAPPGLGVLLLLLSHGLETRLIAEIVVFMQQARLHQLDLGRWDGTRLWNSIWPVWLSTLPLAPVIALWRTLAAQFGRSAEATLRQREQARQAAVVRAQRYAQRRLRRLRPLPDTVQEQLFVGIAIEDEANQ